MRWLKYPSVSLLSKFLPYTPAFPVKLGRRAAVFLPVNRRSGGNFTVVGFSSEKTPKNPICFFPCPPALSAIRGNGFFP